MRVVVIGSGIVGAGAAYYLSGRGASVTVVDSHRPGAATRAGAGIVCPWVDHPEDDDWYRLTREGARHYPGLVEELGEDIGYAKVGALLVAEDPVDLEPVRALLRRRHPAAPEMGDVVDVDTPSELFPPLSDELSAILVPGAARVEGSAVRDALLRAAVRQGAEVRTGTATLAPDGQVLIRPKHGEPPLREIVHEPREGGEAVESTAAAGGRPAAVGPQDSWRQAAPLAPAATAPAATTEAPSYTGEGRPIDADMVIVAAGAWTGEVCRPLGVELPVFPRRGQILHATLEGVDTAWWPIILPRLGPYLLGFPDSRVVVGATVEDVGFAPRVTMGGLEEVIEAGLRVAPGLFGATVAETRVGLRPVYAPGPALIGPLTGRVVVATGLSAYGLTAGPYTGEIAAALALGEEPPIDITPYAPATV
ncbi:FAD-binding oxidoreductase [Nonomuraea sp. K274]|uniref:FAD-binding oxidoreductase n=1 Tax=Nonomuraea cypriaca TaxID=1187855 RepID=A0A931F7P8_9ACTN|nr:FAD-dependent oxidoreductase [Nonomuraea cypriaca]MBF8194421.1 FAD-binding oxidoreductase [Nonomuraea cypriaca]